MSSATDIGDVVTTARARAREAVEAARRAALERRWDLARRLADGAEVAADEVLAVTRGEEAGLRELEAETARCRKLRHRVKRLRELEDDGCPPPRFGQRPVADLVPETRARIVQVLPEHLGARHRRADLAVVAARGRLARAEQALARAESGAEVTRLELLVKEAKRAERAWGRERPSAAEDCAREARRLEAELAEVKAARSRASKRKLSAEVKAATDALAEAEGRLEAMWKTIGEQ